jgi:hypothetical protein
MNKNRTTFNLQRFAEWVLGYGLQGQVSVAEASAEGPASGQWAVEITDSCDWVGVIRTIDTINNEVWN